MNCVRRHLSAIKGGRLAAACHPARVVTLPISDVPGDDPDRHRLRARPSPDPTTCADALAILRRYAHRHAARRRSPCSKAARARRSSPATRGCRHRDADHRDAADGAGGGGRVAREPAARRTSWATRSKARRARSASAGRHRAQVARRGQPVRGALRAALRRRDDRDDRGRGRGGRNVEFLLALGVALDGLPGVHAIAGDTDGVDGPEEIAGAC